MKYCWFCCTSPEIPYMRWPHKTLEGKRRSSIRYIFALLITNSFPETNDLQWQFSSSNKTSCIHSVSQWCTWTSPTNKLPIIRDLLNTKAQIQLCYSRASFHLSMHLLSKHNLLSHLYTTLCSPKSPPPLIPIPLPSLRPVSPCISFRQPPSLRPSLISNH